MAPLAWLSWLVVGACAVDVDSGDIETDTPGSTSMGTSSGTGDGPDGGSTSSTSSSDAGSSGAPAPSTSGASDSSDEGGGSSSSTGESVIDDPLTVEDACGGAGSFACEQCEVDGTFRVRLDHDDGGGYYSCEDLPDGTICTISSELGLPNDGVLVTCEGIPIPNLWDFEHKNFYDNFAELGLCGASASVALDGSSYAPIISLMVAPPGTPPIEDVHLFPELMILRYGTYPEGGCQYSLHPVQ